MIAPGTATPTADYKARIATLAFSPTQLTRTIAISIKNDRSDEDNETLNVTLTGVTGSIGLGELAAATVMIMDDDNPPAARINKPTVRARENAGNALVTVSLSAPSGRPVTLTLTTNNVTAEDGLDYTGTATNNALATVMIAAGQRSRVVQIPITNDPDDEPDETFTVVLSNPVNASLSTTTATVTILDDDVAVAAMVATRATHARRRMIPLSEIIDLLLDSDLASRR
jgi:hypothetical protein